MAIQSLTLASRETAAMNGPAERGTTVAHAILRTLRRLGADRLFGIPGGTVSPLYDAALDIDLNTDLEILTFQHESMAVHAAAGYALATGRPGVVLVTSGPGILNAVTGVASTYCGEVPLLLLGGEVAARNAGRGALQDGGPLGLDLERLLAPVTKRTEGLAHSSRAVPMVEQAWAEALSHPRGPVFLRLPFDLARETIGEPSLSPVPVTLPPEPDAAACRRIAEQLAAAERPALFVGVGARQSGAREPLLRLAEAAGCPVIADIEGKGVYPESRTLCLGVYGVGARGPATAYLAAGVDLLITVGARLDDTTTMSFGPAFAKAGRLVQLDHTAARLGRAFAPAVAMACDLPAALTRIADALPPLAPERRRARLEAVEALHATVPALAADDPAHREPAGPPHDPRRATVALRHAFGPRAAFTADIGNHLLFAAQELTVDHAEDLYASIGLGSMGSGIGAAIGLQLAWGRERQVVSICGDGGLLMAGNEIATCAHYGIPLVFAVFNDGQLGMVEHGLRNVYGRAGDNRTPPLDIATYAASLGAVAVRIEDLAEIETAARWPRNGRPLVLDIPVDPAIRASNPREATLNFSE
jgi:acetolactate synthase-1/2/3 large subunit